MCTFKITNIKTKDPDFDAQLKLGGPNHTRTISVGNVDITHNLLYITGSFSPQPVEVDGKIFLLMGELYNWNEQTPSDVHWGIRNYLKHGSDFVNYVDGEYLFIVYDTVTSDIDFFQDPWGTRQLFYYQRGTEFCFSTLPVREPGTTTEYRFTHYAWMTDPEFAADMLKTDPDWAEHNRRIPGNSHYRYNTDTQEMTCVNSETHTWDLRQYKTDYTDLERAFESAVLKRWKPNATVFLSGGVDSCAIAACLQDHGKQFNSITLQLEDYEDETTINDVLEYTKDTNRHVWMRELGTPSEQHQQVRDLMTKRLSLAPVTTPLVEIRERSIDLWQNNVIIMGSGADEIFDNYRSKSMSEFKIWPEDLKTIFPWTHWYEGLGRRLIDFHETLCLGYGLEKRNPFYDREFAQEWLSLTSTLKNSEHKGFLRTYLRDRGIRDSARLVGFQVAKVPYPQIELGKNLTGSNR